MTTKLTPHHRDEAESQFEESLRPQSFGEFIGQKKVVTNLKIAIQAAHKRKEPLDHVLFSGLPGLGKTTLARLISFEMRSNFKQTSGPILKKPGDLVSLLTKLEAGDILFIDEIHRITADVEEYLYSAMEDFFINITLDKGPNSRTLTLPLKKFTLVGATTREGLLSEPFRSRFGIMERLEFYSKEDLCTILMRSAKILKVKVDPPSADLIASRSRWTPRIANRYLRRVRDLAQVKSGNVITPEIAAEGLKMLGIDRAGLVDLDRQILKTIINHRGGPVGLKTISAAVGEEEDTIEEIYEPYLIQQSFLEKSPRGRKATEKAFKHLDAAPGQDPQKNLFN